MPESTFTFKDFDESYIQALAAQHGFTYTKESKPAGLEDSLYNNSATNTTELYKLEFVVGELKCKYYTADYVPVIIKNNQLLADTEVLAPLEASVALANQFVVQIFSVELPHDVEYLYVESRTNLTLNNILGLRSIEFKRSETVQLEGDFSNFFRVHTPAGQGISAFTILAPNIMLKILRSASDYDFEFSKNKVYFYQTFATFQSGKIPLDKTSYEALLQFGVESAREMARAARPAKVLDVTGYTPMWKLFGGNSVKLMFTMVVFSGIFFFLIMALFIPFLWPLLVVLGGAFLVKYLKLKRKRKKLIEHYVDS